MVNKVVCQGKRMDINIEGLPGVWGSKGTWPISRGTEKKNLREHGNFKTVLRITGTNIVNIVKGI